jgi:hypothetical protein
MYALLRHVTTQAVVLASGGVSGSCERDILEMCAWPLGRRTFNPLR